MPFAAQGPENAAVAVIAKEEERDQKNRAGNEKNRNTAPTPTKEFFWFLKGRIEAGPAS